MVSANGVVAYMVAVGVLGTESAKRAARYIARHTAEYIDYHGGVETDGVVDVQIHCPKTGVVLWEFTRLEISGFLDWAYLVGLLDAKVLINAEGKSEGEYVHPVASLINRVNVGRANGIAQRQVERRRLVAENIGIGRAYYADAAHTLLNEACFGTTGWQIVRVESMTTIKHNFKSTRISKTGLTGEQDRVRSAYLVNGEIVVRNSRLARMVYLDFARCEGSLVAISPRGILTMPSTRERKTVDGKETTEITGLDPTLSFMRLTYILVSNAFFVLELGSQSTKHQPLAAEMQDSRGIRDQGPYRETTVDEFAVIEESPEFSKQEKHICAALGIVVGDNVEGLTAFLGLTGNVGSGDNLRHTGNNVRQVMMRQWYEVFCGVANTKPHVKHFSRMVKNFKKHVRRFFTTERPDEVVALPPAPPMFSGCNLKAMFHELAAKPEKLVPLSPIGCQWAQSHSIALKGKGNGGKLDGWLVGYYDQSLKCAVEHFQTELVTVGGDCI